jgi:hypothetical protein
MEQMLSVYFPMRQLVSILTSVFLLNVAFITAPISNINAQTLSTKASANQKYKNLVQVLPCPTDRRTYGDYKDYGYWSGGSWCGQQGIAGNWVWAYPNWYVWSHKSTTKENSSDLLKPASVQGKYSTLLQVLNCPSDRGSYGSFKDYGYWGGGEWCGQQGVAGNWVWAYPNWYVWKYQN